MQIHSGPHCPECVLLGPGHDMQCHVLFEGVDGKIDDLNAKWDDVYKTLTGGDPLHPNGLRDKVERNEKGLSKLQTEFDVSKASTKASARGMVIGATIAAGLSGGGIATAVLKIWGA